jgi:hypothetical protein
MTLCGVKNEPGNREDVPLVGRDSRRVKSRGLLRIRLETLPKTRLLATLFLPDLCVSSCGFCLSSRQKQQKKRSYTTPTLPWVMADCTFSRWPSKSCNKYQRPSVMYSLLHTESAMRRSMLSYSWSADTVNSFLCDLREFWSSDMLLMCETWDILMGLYVARVLRTLKNVPSLSVHLL